MSTPNVAHATLPTAQLIEAVQLPPVRQADTGQEQMPQALFAAIKGDPGPPGGALIGGHPAAIHNAEVGDVLSFTGDAWTNRSQGDVTDGGNF